MIINNTLQGVAGAYLKNTAPVKQVSKQEKPPVANARDEFVLSRQARDFGSALQGIKANAGDVRADRVAILAEQFEKGTYKIDAQGIASKLISMRF